MPASDDGMFSSSDKENHGENGEREARRQAKAESKKSKVVIHQKRIAHLEETLGAKSVSGGSALPLATHTMLMASYYGRRVTAGPSGIREFCAQTTVSYSVTFSGAPPLNFQTLLASKLY